MGNMSRTGEPVPVQAEAEIFCTDHASNSVKLVLDVPTGKTLVGIGWGTSVKEG